MRVEIEVNGLVRTVTVERSPSQEHRLRVNVGGRRHMIDARRLGGGRLSIIRLDGAPTSHEMTVTAAGLRGHLDVQLCEGVFRAVVGGGRVGHLSEGPGAAGRREVVAPMLGRVVRVMVSVGDEVVEQQELIVVEAMKMENALVAPRGGRVGEIAAHKGMVVEAGQLLATVE